MLTLQKSEQVISVEQNLYNHLCVSQPYLNVSYCLSMDKVITQLLGVWIYNLIYTTIGDRIQ